MKFPWLKFVVVTSVLILSVRAAEAELLDWADGVHEYSSNIQDYDGNKMTADTEWWLTGEPDDFVAGWRSNAPGEYIVMHWDLPLADVVGDDLRIRLYGGPRASAQVLASVDGRTFTELGTLEGTAQGDFVDSYFDFAGKFGNDAVSFVKVLRVGNGPNTGMFFDAFAGHVVPEPGSLVLMLTAAGLLAAWKWRRP